MLYPIILSGGFGTRLWPLSRQALPKQLLPLIGEASMLQETVRRLDGVPDVAAPSLICNQEHRFLIAEQMREIARTPRVLMLEPVGRNTAPAVCTAALHIAASDPDALLLVLPSDHAIADAAGFQAAIARGRELAQAGRLVTFGVVPDKPETGYGYIQRGKALDGRKTAFEVARFVEKPDAPTAARYVQSGRYFWNSGMFLMRAATLLEEMEQFAPEVLAACRESLSGAYSDLDFLRLEEAAFARSPAISLDFAIMEKTSRGAVVPIQIGWSDVGSFAALWEYHAKDGGGNATRGEVMLQDARNCYINAEKCLVAAVGVEDLIIVATVDAVLVAHRDRAQSVKSVVEQLQREGRSEHELHRKVYRPWGSYEGMDRGERFQVKRIIVKPGQKLSMQRHHHRSEHWVVVSGTAEVTINDAVHLVAENESIYIPLGALHRIHNPGRIPLHFIEVQSGPYLGEDDIVRTEDHYGRTEEH